MTTNARKQAARDYQLAHGVSYTEALRAVTPDTDTGSGADLVDPLRVDQRFLDALEIADVASFDPWPGWQRAGGAGELQLPVGVTAAAAVPTMIDLDLGSSTWALVGAPGSGKSTALQAMVLGLAVRYPPTRVAFALADLKGCTFAGLEQLPHIKALCQRSVDDHPYPYIADWCAQLDEEMDRRHSEIGRRRRDLVVVIDAFDELLIHNPEVCATAQRLINEGMVLGMRLIIASNNGRLSMLHTSSDGHPEVTLIPDSIMAFRTCSRSESVEILGEAGAAEELRLGIGEAIIRRSIAVEGPVSMFSAAEVASVLAQRLGC